MNQPDTERYVPTITTCKREYWEHLIALGREIGPETILSAIKSPKIGAVYLFAAVGSDFYKIGFSSSEDGVEKRLKACQTGCPYELKCILSFRTIHFRYIEKFLHIMFGQNCVRSEWFQFDESEVELIREFFKRFHDDTKTS